MICTVCRCRSFTRSEYHTAGCTAPAMSCDGCGALNLGEEVATTEEERDSVRLAVAMRASIVASFHDAASANP
ncbi:MAG TPA: hypothetical protein VKU41_11760 [Polyangiaceae bacterium]|nr:hypothetical protein [Polyangiaceae bacterium]